MPPCRVPRLESASPPEKALTLQRRAAFPDAAGRWDAFAAAAKPGMVINHTSGEGGSFFNVTGTGFSPNSVASIGANDHLLGEQPVDGNGALAFALTTDQADPGVYHLRVQVNPVVGVQFQGAQNIAAQLGDGLLHARQAAPPVPAPAPVPPER